MVIHNSIRVSRDYINRMQIAFPSFPYRFGFAVTSSLRSPSSTSIPCEMESACRAGSGGTLFKKLMPFVHQNEKMSRCQSAEAACGAGSISQWNLVLRSVCRTVSLFVHSLPPLLLELKETKLKSRKPLLALSIRLLNSMSSRSTISDLVNREGYESF